MCAQHLIRKWEAGRHGYNIATVIINLPTNPLIVPRQSLGISKSWATVTTIENLKLDVLAVRHGPSLD
jgi:hypothetical protein